MVDIKLKDNVYNDFAKWFAESNKILSKFAGFISRRVLKDGDGRYRVLIEFQDRDTFTAMHQSSEHQELHKVGHAFFSEPPVRRDFTIFVQ